jgi:hypothetical protein
LNSALFSIPIDGLRISEVHYHPAAPSEAERAAGYANRDDFEFIELVNAGTSVIDLRQVRLVQSPVDGDLHGVEFDFGSGRVTQLTPGERVMVVENLGAFQARYGNGLPVAGQWTGGRLANGAEQLTLRAGDMVIQQFTYRDEWYPITDGGGHSLEIINIAETDLDRWNRRAAWRPSLRIGGTPGQAGSIPGDSNRDGNFDSSDLVLVFQAGEYEDAIAANSTFAEGDWNGDGEFDMRDLVLAFQVGLYESAALPT